MEKSGNIHYNYRARLRRIALGRQTFPGIKVPSQMTGGYLHSRPDDAGAWVNSCKLRGVSGGDIGYSHGRVHCRSRRVSAGREIGRTRRREWGRWERRGEEGMLDINQSRASRRSRYK